MNNNGIQLFDNPELNAHIRVIEIDGEPWFIAKDVCKVLGTQTNNIRVILDKDEIASLPRTYSIEPGSNGGSDNVFVQSTALRRGYPSHNGRERYSSLYYRGNRGPRKCTIISEPFKTQETSVWAVLDNLHCLKTDRDYVEQKVKDVAGNLSMANSEMLHKLKCC